MPVFGSVDAREVAAMQHVERVLLGEHGVRLLEEAVAEALEAGFLAVVFRVVQEEELAELGGGDEDSAVARGAPPRATGMIRSSPVEVFGRG